MAKEVAPSTGSLYNALCQGTQIKGNIEADRDLRIDGDVEGNITCTGKVVVSQTGIISGKIACVNAEIGGRVVGDIVVSELLTLRSTANIEGDVKTKSLVVEPSAVFNGTCSMKQAVESADVTER
jgi:cytoskeletal protein CcmA (bactofilin family)